MIHRARQDQALTVVLEIGTEILRRVRHGDGTGHHQSGIRRYAGTIIGSATERRAAPGRVTTRRRKTSTAAGNSGQRLPISTGPPFCEG